jgi:hypothetical protein
VPFQLGKGHNAKLLGASQAAHARVAALALNDSRKACPWNEFHDLRKQGLADIHGKSPRGLSLENCMAIRKQVSNRYQKNWRLSVASRMIALTQNGIRCS